MAQNIGTENTNSNPHHPAIPVYQKLLDDCYQNHGNELTREKLQKYALFAQTIEDPLTYGKFQNEKHYLDTLHLVLESTLETRNRILFFLKKMLPLLKTTTSLLDVGPGDAELTLPLITYFDHLTAVDLNHRILSKLKKLIPTKLDYLPIESCILEAQLHDSYYDLAVLSHNLYYIHPSDWLRVVEKTHQSLKHNGILVVVLGGDEAGKADLIRNFGGKTLEIDHLAMKCIESFGQENVDLYASDEIFASLSLDGMVHIAAFMLCDAGVTSTKKELEAYIASKLQCAEYGYKLTTRQKFIVIRK